MAELMTYTLITGACGGLGGAFVWGLARRGEPLYLTGRSEERLLRLKEELSREFPALPVKTFAADLTDGEQRKSLLFSLEEGEKIGRLVYVAGADIQKEFTKYTEEKLVFQIRVNFEAAVSLARAVLSQFPEGRGEILAVGSVSGIYPMPYFALYSATKKALSQFFYALHDEVKPNVKVTCVLPGAIPTRDDIKENIKSQGRWGKLAAKSPEFVAKKSLKALRKNKKSEIIGFWNKLMRFFTACIPSGIRSRYIARRWKKTEKDAF